MDSKRALSLVMLVALACKDPTPVAQVDASQAALSTPSAVVDAAALPTIDPPNTFVSIIALLGDPRRYAGHRITVTGYLKLEFEGNAVYLHKEDFDNMLTNNGLWLDMSGCKAPKFTEGYAIIEGVFDPDQHGHMGLFGGTLKNISRLDPSNGAAIRHPTPTPTPTALTTTSKPSPSKGQELGF
jgi:hypothetical protein